jgi:hypothetical protein
MLLSRTVLGLLGGDGEACATSWLSGRVMHLGPAL